MALPLNGRVAIVTGSSRGIGRAIAVHLASLGANLVINYASNSTQADSLVSELNSNSTNLRAIAVQADVSDPGGPKSLFDRAEEAFNSPVHIFVNCAGVIDSKYSTISSMPIEDFDAIFNINARGAFLCIQEASNRIVRGGGGRIITISTSMVGALMPNYGAYTASKAAVEAMTKILAKEMKGTRITANGVAPGPIATELFFEGKSEEMIRRLADMNPMGRIGETKDVAPLVGFLCTDEGEWVNGQHWIKDLRFSNTVKDEEGFPSFALINKATGHALKHSLGQGQPVRLVPYNPDFLDESILWSESKDLGDGFRCIRMVNNIRLNFDALHGDEDHGGVHDGTTLVLYEWFKGKNQRWKIAPYY